VRTAFAEFFTLGVVRNRSMNEEPLVTDHTSDAQLLARWAEGCQHAGGELIDRHYAALDRFFHDKVGSEEVAEDLIQQTLLACLEARDRFRAESAFKTFLLGIARNKLLVYYRNTRRRGTFDPHITSLCDLGTSPTARFARGELRSLLTRALHRIPLEMQIVLELAYWQELDGPALAAVLGVTVNTAYSRVHRAKAALSAELQALGG
jgi:RNA polymerase sigma factor (sigma-70 family)